jgi:transposase
MRERYVAHRTGLINQTRGLLSEYGIIAHQGHKAFRQYSGKSINPHSQGYHRYLKRSLAKLRMSIMGTWTRLMRAPKLLSKLPMIIRCADLS